MDFARPALLVQNDTYEAPTSETWAERLNKARAGLDYAIRSVGRIEVREHPNFEWVGTGWLVAPGIVVTNRHVAELFCRSDGKHFQFRQNHLGRTMSARLDYREEYQIGEQEEVAVNEIIHIEPDDGPDMAFLRLEFSDEGRGPISLNEDAKADTHVATIGYPAWDGRRNDPDLMARTFNDIYNVKRLQPGVLLSTSDTVIAHDCSTLGGNSGSVVLSLSSGRAVGLHFGGRFKEANWAVPCSTIKSRMHSLGLAK